ncbi:hypothetical protein PC122_g22543 [Phytophthora cactorum]|nr:hypothetical protein PC122_g22543 [Phytophthora cactorum]
MGRPRMQRLKCKKMCMSQFVPIFTTKKLNLSSKPLQFGRWTSLVTTTARIDVNGETKDCSTYTLKDDSRAKSTDDRVDNSEVGFVHAINNRKRLDNSLWYRVQWRDEPDGYRWPDSWLPGA